ncbi:hypothetical protein NC653_020362 [Populus alba x Populus x berolinensis]|uniref:Uncharacterized protein n=1 Tax=Populus alba x Populus x berolinensis TaxID=444605 RepID=A0AAD6QEE2_9ROSI|nr:hypothetical protein NC653_020362 [Populus alba x Populus x berolinensis]
MIIKREGLSGIFNKTHLDLEVKNDGKKGRHKRRRSRHSESKALVSLHYTICALNSVRRMGVRASMETR